MAKCAIAKMDVKTLRSHLKAAKEKNGKKGSKYIGALKNG